MGQVFIRHSPRVALRRSFLADPMEAVGSDLGETPSSLQTARVIADLDDVLTLGPPDLARVVLVERVTPDDVPATDPGIEDAQSRAIHGGRRRAPGPDPDILNCATFKHPAEMALSSQLLDCAVVEMTDRVHLPASDQPPVQVHLSCSVGWGAFRSESIEERGNCDCHGLLQCEERQGAGNAFWVLGKIAIEPW